MMGNGADLAVMPLHEIDFAAIPPCRPHNVSYAATWDEAHVDYAGTKPVPLRGLAPAVVARIEEVARAAWHALGLRDYGRVDLRVADTGEIYVLEVNASCYLERNDEFTMAANHAGISYDDLVQRIVELARERYGK